MARSSKPASNVVPMPTKPAKPAAKKAATQSKAGTTAPAKDDKPAPAPEIVPHAGWRVQSRYGVQRSVRHGYLVRLEDIHAYLLDKGDAPEDAAYMVFSQWASTALGSGGDKSVLAALYLLKPINRPIAIWEKRYRTEAGAIASKNADIYIKKEAYVVASAEAERMFKRIPQLSHSYIENGSFEQVWYGLCIAAVMLWHGASDVTMDDAAKDHIEGWRTEAEAYGYSWPDDEWLRNLLGRLAVSHSVANQLWGWGTVVEAVASVESEKNTSRVNWKDPLAETRLFEAIRETQAYKKNPNKPNRKAIAEELLQTVAYCNEGANLRNRVSSALASKNTPRHIASVQAREVASPWDGLKKQGNGSKG